MLNDVEAVRFGFQHHVPHVHRAGQNDNRLFLVMDAGDKFLTHKNRRLAEMQTFGRAVERQQDFVRFSSRQRHEGSPDWARWFARSYPGSKTIFPPRLWRS